MSYSVLPVQIKSEPQTYLAKKSQHVPTLTGRQFFDLQTAFPSCLLFLVAVSLLELLWCGETYCLKIYTCSKDTDFISPKVFTGTKNY